MFYFDLLYPNAEKRQLGRKNMIVGEKLIQDLQLEELVLNGVIGKEEYDMLYTETLYLPSDREVITFRQDILKDLADNPSFIKKCMDFCGRLKDNVPRKRVNIWESSEPVYKILQEHISVLRENCLTICAVDFKAAFQSETLVRLVEFLGEEVYKNRLKEIIGLLEEVLDAKALGYQVEYTYGQVMDRVIIKDLFQENRYVIKEKGMLKRKTADEDYLISAEGNLILRNNMNEIYAKTIVKLCDFASRLNGAIVGAFKKMRQELSYYQAGIKLLAMYRRMGVPACMPQIVKGCGGFLEFRQLYPVRLLAKCNAGCGTEQPCKIQGNDYKNDRGKIAVITGFNSGGKTTFLQGLGTAQIFLQLGFFVPARFCRAAAAPYIGSLFANVEDIRTVHGKLEQELVEIREMAGQLKDGSLILMNEILSTTSEEEGTDIMAEVLGAFSHTHSNILFVTHLSRLASLVREGVLTLADGEKAVNYVTKRCREEEKKFQKTYRIEPGWPEKDSCEEQFMNESIEETLSNYFPEATKVAVTENKK